MFGGSGKNGRSGRGGGAGKRSIHSAFHPPPLHRASAAPSGRLSMPVSGASRVPRGRNTTNSSSGTTASYSPGTGTGETFSLVTGNPLNFAMIIRLAPDLVEEIKRVEEQGSSARIKFDPYANNPSGNVINVGGKDFKFTWSREPGDLCDIYEEQKGSEDGNGMLVESGCAWRKLNVQRVLDESTKKHVKMRSVEAERKHNSRKAIVLDAKNPSMKNPMKALAAAETNSWRTQYKQKKEPPFKKQKTEPPPGGPLKSKYKSNLSTTMPSKGRHSVSPLLPPHEQSGLPASPFGSGDPKKGRASIENVLGTQAKHKTTSSEKDMHRKVVNSAGLDKQGRKREMAKPAELRSMLISLLKDNPSGMSFKALEKAIGDAFPNSVKQIEPIIKKIATYQAPGKYIFKPGAEMEGFKKPSPEDGSCPSDSHYRSPADAKYDQLSAPEPSIPVRADRDELEELGNLDSKHGEATDDFEKIDIEHHSPDIFGEKKISDTEGPKGSTSGSGSDSDSGSDSSDSGSHRSKSRSPMGSSSSDSESDVSNSKEASDEDVDILLSDDEKELKQKLLASEPGQLKSPFAWKTADSKLGSIGTADKLGDHAVDVVEIEKDLLGDDNVGQIVVATSSISNKGGQGPEEGTKSPSPKRYDQQESQVYAGSSHSERGNMARANYEQSDKSLRRVSKSKLKRGHSEKDFDSKFDRAKRLKAANYDQAVVTGTRNPYSAESPRDPSLDLHKSSVENGRCKNSRREPSDLELGELPELLPEETPGMLFERKSSFKHSDNKLASSECWNSDSNKGKPAGRVTSKSGSTPPPNADVAVPGILKGSKNSSPDHYSTDSTRYHSSVQPYPEQNQPRVDRTDPGSRNNKLVEVNSNNRESDVGLGNVSLLQQHDSRQGVVLLSSRANSKLQSNTSTDLNDRRTDISLTESNDGGRKRRESSAEENSCSYSKYGKEEPELKGSIKDFSQYEEYVQEYNEKYKSYFSLNKILESYRNEFSLLGRNLEASKGKDTERYYDLLAQLKESYRQCGAKHKRLKKIFIVLHEELKHLKNMIKEFAASYVKD